MYESFRNCGFAALFCVLIGFAGTVVGIVGVVLATRARGPGSVLGAVAAALGVLAICVGVIGKQVGIGKVMAATSSQALDPGQRDRIRAIGMMDAGQCVTWGTGTGTLPLVLGVLALGLGVSARKKAAS